MSYLTQSRIAADLTIMFRITACATALKVRDPRFWVQENMWEFATQDGWDTAWEESPMDDPGADEAAITDQMILTAVNAIRDSEPESDDYLE